MARIRAFATATVATAAVGAALVSMAAPASADPQVYRKYAGVGSDTTQFVINAAAGDAQGVNGVLKGYVSSYDAFTSDGSTTIQTKANGPVFTRPSGSGAGLAALYASVTGTTFKGTAIAGQVDFARSSSFNAQTSGTGNPSDRAADYVPFARDGVSYAYKGGSATTVGKLTTAQLQAIYSSNTATVINKVKVTPLLPQTSSGTRKFWLQVLGVTTPGAAVQTVGAENDGTQLPSGTSTTAYIIPFSAAQWVAQTNQVQPDLRNGAKLGAPNGTVAVSGSGTATKPSATFFNGAFGRNVYNVIDDANTDSTLRGLFINTTDGSGNTVASPLCSSAGLALSAKFGFAAISSSAPQLCGNVVVGGYPPAQP